MRTRTWLSAIRRAFAGGRLVGRGIRLEGARRLEAARDAFLSAREAAGDADGGFLEPVLDSVRLTATTRLSCLSAALGDHARAEAFAREGLGLCAAARLSARSTRKLAFLAEWEAWARRYLAGRP